MRLPNPKYYIKTRVKQFKMKELFDNYYSFDIIDDITEINFAMFKDFYENGGLDGVNWESDDYHSTAKKSMDRLYFYINYLKPKGRKLYEKLLDKWATCNIVSITKQGIKFREQTEQEHKIFDVMQNLENFLFDKDEEYLHLLVSIRKYLWT